MKNKELKERYIDILMENEKSGSWRKYYNEKIDRVVELSNGYLVALSKPSIETSFCFGYSLSSRDSEDYDRANRCAEFASKNEEYFYRENMKKVERLEEEATDKRYIPMVNVAYITLPKDSKARSLSFYRQYRVDEGNIPPDSERISEEDREKMAIEYKDMKECFSKRLKTYLKRYGLSKVKTWSFWQDA